MSSEIPDGSQVDAVLEKMRQAGVTKIMDGPAPGDLLTIWDRAKLRNLAEDLPDPVIATLERMYAIS